MSSGNQQGQQVSEIRVVPAAKIVGRRLEGPRGHDLGDIDSLVIDIQNGAIEFVLIDPSGAFNSDNELIAVPWRALQTPHSGREPIMTRVSIDELAQAPRVDRRFVFELNRPGPRGRIYNYWGYAYPPPAYRNNGYRYDQYGQGGNAGAYGASRSGSVNGEQGSGANGGQGTSASAGGGSNGLIVGRNGVVATLESGSTTSARALQDAQVYATKGNQIGTIDEVMIDARRGKVAFVLLARGGFLGMDRSWFALPVEALTQAPYENGYRLTVDASLLNKQHSVHVNRNDLPTRVSASQLTQLYQDFGMTPYWKQGSQASRGQNASAATQTASGANASGPEWQTFHHMVAFHHAKVSLADAISAAKAHSNGTVFDVSFDAKRNKPVYDVKTYQNGSVWEGTVDASSGQVIGAGKTTPEDQLGQQEQSELKGLQNAKTTLMQAVHLAEQQGNGKSVSASLDQSGGNVVYDVAIVPSKPIQQVKIDPTNGQIVGTGTVGENRGDNGRTSGSSQ